MRVQTARRWLWYKDEVRSRYRVTVRACQRHALTFLLLDRSAACEEVVYDYDGRYHQQYVD